MNRTIGLITSNFNFKDYGTVAEERTAVSIPFGSRYRLLDFSLSNMVNSGIQTVGLITPYRYRSIIDHIGAGKEWGLDRKDGGLYILPGTAYGFRDEDVRFLFRDVLQNLRYFQVNGDYILISSGTLVCNIDYRPMIARHRHSGQDVTMLYRGTKPGEHHKGYYLKLDDKGRVVGIEHGDEGEYLFLDSFIINKSLLLRLSRDYGNFGQMDTIEILRLVLGEIKVDSFRFDGYVGFVESIGEYFRTSMELMDRSVRAELFNPDRKIITKVHDTPPAMYTKDSEVRSALISAGSIIEGKVENSVVFRSVHIAAGAVVKNCVIMDKCVIEEGVYLENVVIDRYATVRAGTKIVGGADRPCILPKGGVI